MFFAVIVCAAGTGRFLEIMANALGYSIEEFANIPESYDSGLTISSMCTVFAESEVISLISSGVSREEIAIAIHKSISKKVASMAKRIPLVDDIVFVGGCASNKLLINLLERDLGKKIKTNSLHQLAGAIGAAVYAKTM
ncbi:acyl-CoA dehydratase activase [Thermodesulfovibrio hydrogeniphilus]